MLPFKKPCCSSLLFYRNILSHRGSRSRLFLPVLLLFCLNLPGLMGISAAWPLAGTDSEGTPYTLDRPPRRVVCLVPEITEIVIALGAADALVGITRHSRAAEVAGKERVGGFQSPGIEKIEALHPDLILAADLHHGVRARFRDTCPILTLNVFDIDQAMDRLELLGRIFGRQEQAGQMIATIRGQLARVARKLAGIPLKERQRVVRLMGRDRLMVPGDDSFQNDFIRAAGAIPPEFGQRGQVIAISPEQLRDFDPQAVYVCGTGELPEILSAAAVREVSAIRHDRVFSFSCDLTCRAGVNIGTFVTLLAGRIYGGELAELARHIPTASPAACVMEGKQ